MGIGRTLLKKHYRKTDEGYECNVQLPTGGILSLTVRRLPTARWPSWTAIFNNVLISTHDSPESAAQALAKELKNYHAERRNTPTTC